MIPFFWLARPTGAALATGGALALAGLLLRAWAAGTVHKERALATGGPYAHLRHPLYLGSLLLGVGATVAGGRWGFVALFLAFYAWAYRRALRHEAWWLERLFGGRFRRYRTEVPAFVPRLARYRDPEGGSDGFGLARYLANREWQAALGAAAGFALLALKWRWGAG